MLIKHINGKGRNFDLQLRGVMEELGHIPNVVRLVFFISSVDFSDYYRKYESITNAVKEYCTDKPPVFSCVAQDPLDGSQVTVEIHGVCDSEYEAALYNELDGIEYIVIETPAYRKLYLGGVTSDKKYLHFREGCDEVFRKIGQILHKENMPVSSIVRQWNYIPQITRIEGNTQHYQDFNDARSSFYDNVSWENGYPAATGIGTARGEVTVDLETVLPAEGSHIIIEGIDNQLQVSAFDYSCHVLVGEKDAGKTPPKFERAKSVAFAGKKLLYISGTAAIRGEESLEGIGVLHQTQATIENIENLVLQAGEGVKVTNMVAGNEFLALRVYLKNATDYDKVKAVVAKIYPGVSALYILADVCRDNLLVEIEGWMLFDSKIEEHPVGKRST
ncbi:MAG: hypothetical protein ABFD09_11605 [Proteiniphilum sp.]